jgi:RNA polymerase sigma-70 factor (ECF subfamily)
VNTEERFAEAWDEHRGFVVDLAFRMLGRIGDAEDVAQETFARLVAADIDDIDDVRAWLVVVSTRLCLDQLRSSRSRRDTMVASVEVDPLDDPAAATADPADRITLDDSISMALAVVLQRLSPPERAAFVLHDVFGFSFEEVAEVVGRTPAACRQAASRARRRVQDGTAPDRFTVDLAEQRQAAERFIAACRTGDVGEVVAVLTEDVAGVVQLAGRTLPPIVGAENVARNLLRFFGPETALTLVSHPVNGEAGVLGFSERRLAVIVALSLEDGLVSHIDAVADPTAAAYDARR